MENSQNCTKIHSTFNTIKYLISRTWILDRSIFMLFAFYTITNSFTPLITVVLPTFVVQELTGGSDLTKILYILAIMLGGGILFNFIAQYCYKIYWPKIIAVRMDFILRLNKKVMSLDYKLVENPDVQDEINKAKSSIGTNQTGIEGILNQLFSMFSSIITLIVFGTILSTLNVFVFLFLMITILVGYYISNHYNTENHTVQTQMSSENRELVYLEQRSQFTGPAKDIRLYNMLGWLKESYWNVIERKFSYIRQISANNFKLACFLSILTFLRDGIVYGYLIVKVFQKTLSLSELTLYFITIMNFSDKLNAIAFSISDMKKQNLYVNDYRTFMERKEAENDYFLFNAKDMDCPVITFENVSFRYPGTDKDVIKNLNYTIRGGTKVALVGENGAGKTTFVKLLCRLYEPNEGCILVNGTDYRKFSKEEYYKMLSVVFQDMDLYAFSLVENISLTDSKSTNRDLAESCINKVNLSKKYKTFPFKLDTNILKKFDSDGIEFSGGEAQKLFLARALYKSGSLVILDEPTAALDSLAEKELYENFSKLTENKTALYVSHRLASTRFCDEIIFLDGGEILEKGTHEELMHLGGAYANFYDVQSKYYVN